MWPQSVLSSHKKLLYRWQKVKITEQLRKEIKTEKKEFSKKFISEQ